MTKKNKPERKVTQLEERANAVRAARDKYIESNNALINLHQELDAWREENQKEEKRLSKAIADATSERIRVDRELQNAKEDLNYEATNDCADYIYKDEDEQ